MRQSSFVLLADPLVESLVDPLLESLLDPLVDPLLRSASVLAIVVEV